jgi:hypothetical protein
LNSNIFIRNGREDLREILIFINGRFIMKRIILVVLAALPFAVVFVFSAADVMAQSARLLQEAKAAYGDTCECVNAVLGKTGKHKLVKYRNQRASVPDIGLQVETIKFNRYGKILSVEKKTPKNAKAFKKQIPGALITDAELKKAKGYNPWGNKGVWISRDKLKPGQLRPDLIVQTNLDGKKKKTHIHNKECPCVNCTKVEIEKSKVRKVAKEIDRTRRQQASTKR